MASFGNLFMIHVPKTGGSYVTWKALAHECATKEKLIYGRSGPGGDWIPSPHRNHWPKRFFTYGHYHCLQKTQFDFPHQFNGRNQECAGYDNSLRFSIVRNPFDILISLYFFKYPHNPVPINAKKFPNISWPEFVRTFCSPDEKWLPQVGSPLKRFMFFQMFDDDGACCAHEVLRMETLDDDLARICRPLDIVPIKAPRYNTTDHRFINRNDAPDSGGWHGEGGKKLEGRDPDFRIYYDDELRELVEKKCQRELTMFGYSFDGHVDERISVEGIRYKFDTDRVL